MRAHPAGPRHGDLVAEHAHGVAPDDLSDIDARIWAKGVTRDARGVMTLHTRKFPSLANEFGTPLFLMDETDFRSRARGYVTAFAGADVYYASKAFSCTAALRWAADEGLSLDVATGGELAIAQAAGFPGEKILFHGNNKSTAELIAAVEYGVRRIVVDSELEISRIAEVASDRGIRQQVLIRITVGVEAHTHEFIATAHEDQKFGFSLSTGEATAAVKHVLDQPSLELVGIHSHIGSQIFDTSGFEVAAHRSVGFLADIKDSQGVEIAELNLGGGLGIAYVATDDPADVVEVAHGLRTIVDRECEALGLEVPRLAFEPGRAIVGPTMCTVYEVGTVKPIELDGGVVRLYVSVDGGMSDNPRTALYGAEYTAVLASRASDAVPALSRVVGKHCESGDVVVNDVWLPGDLKPGDLLAVAATGAYCRSMASNYNAMGRPPVVALSEGRTDGEVIIRRETQEDLLLLDPGAHGRLDLH